MTHLDSVVVHFPMTAEQAELIAEPIANPFIPGMEVHLPDRDGVEDEVTIRFDDVVTLVDKGRPVTLSRLGIINALLDQVYPGFRLVTHVPDESGEHSPDNVYGLELRQL